MPDYRSFSASFLLFILIPTELLAQPENWEIRNYTTKDGLSSNHVNCIIKDSKGYMWFGTNTGLNRFDSSYLHSREQPQICCELSFFHIPGTLIIQENQAKYLIDPGGSNFSIHKNKFFGKDRTY